MKKYLIVISLVNNIAFGTNQPTQLTEQPQQSQRLVESARSLERWRYLGLGAWQDENAANRFAITANYRPEQVPLPCMLDYQILLYCCSILQPRMQEGCSELAHVDFYGDELSCSCSCCVGFNCIGAALCGVVVPMALAGL